MLYSNNKPRRLMRHNNFRTMRTNKITLDIAREICISMGCIMGITAE